MVKRYQSDDSFVTSGAIFDRAKDRDLNRYLRDSVEFYCWWCGKSGVMENCVVENEMPYHPECLHRSKSKYRNPKQIRMTKTANPKQNLKANRKERKEKKSIRLIR